MKKRLKIVVVFDCNAKNFATYHASLAGSGFLVQLASNKEEFWEKVNEFVPDVIVLQGDDKNVHYEKVIQKIRQNNFLQQTPFVVLFNKLNYTNQMKAKELKVEIEVYPIKSSNLLQAVKKVSRHIVFPYWDVDSTKCNNHLNTVVDIGLFDLSEVHCHFKAPFRIKSHHKLHLEVPLFKKLGFETQNFEVDHESEILDSRHYKNDIFFSGLSVDILKNLKEYLMRHRKTNG